MKIEDLLVTRVEISDIAIASPDISPSSVKTMTAWPFECAFIEV
jgi:hypothetical protein